MTREAIGAALLLLGAVVARLTFTGEYLSFVKQSLSIPLLLSAAVLVALGGMALRDGIRRDDDGGDGHDHAHDDDHAATPLSDAVDHEVGDHVGHHHVGAGPRMGALLLAPLGVLMLVPAAPLGAFAADNGAANRVAEMTVYGDLPAATGGAVELDLPEMTGRAVLEPESIEGATLRTIGFVVPSEDEPGSYLLSRFTVGCCAVDAAPFQVLVDPGGAPVPELEQWVQAELRFTGEVRNDGEEEIPVFELVTQELIDEPEVPYIY